MVFLLIHIFVGDLARKFENMLLDEYEAGGIYR
jgi:hypothetical protein